MVAIHQDQDTEAYSGQSRKPYKILYALSCVLGCVCWSGGK